MNGLDLFLGALAGCVVMTFIFGVSWADAMAEERANAIERGYALYCPTTGDFAWKGECNDQ